MPCTIAARRTTPAIEVRAGLRRSVFEPFMVCQSRELKHYEAEGPAPITGTQLLMPRRSEDHRDDLRTTFNHVQENPLQCEPGKRPGTDRSTASTTTRSRTGRYGLLASSFPSFSGEPQST